MDTPVSISTQNLETNPETKNCVNVHTGTITLDEMKQYVTALLEHVQREIVARNSKYVSNCVAEVNMPLLNAYKPRESNTGYAYVWVSRQEVFYMLTGKNYDGKKTVLQLESSTPIELMKNPLAWDDSGDIPALRYKILPFIKKEEDDVQMFFTPTEVKRISSDDYSEGKLFCRTYLDPKKFTSEDILAIFSMFTTSDSKLTVIPNHRGHFFINFENVDDVYFALCMRKKYRDSRTGLLIEFDHAIKKQTFPTSFNSQGNRTTNYKKKYSSNR